MKKWLFLLVSILIASGCSNTPKESTAPTAAKKEYHEGLQYHRIEPAQPTKSGDDRVEVVELFFYACPHCYELESKIREWLKDKPEYVDFRRIPAIVGPTWGEQAKMFYIAEKLDILDKTHEALFKSIHEDGKQYYNEHAVVTFFVNQGVEPQTVFDLFRSQEITDKASQARVMTVKYGLRGVPAMVVNGKYKTAPYFVRNQEEMIEVVDMLVEKERAELTKSSRPAAK